MLVQWSDEDQAYLVTLPEWADHVLRPVTHGETYEEAIRNGHEAQALEALIASAHKHQEPLPEPRVFLSV